MNATSQTGVSVSSMAAFGPLADAKRGAKSKTDFIENQAATKSLSAQAELKFRCQRHPDLHLPNSVHPIHLQTPFSEVTGGQELEVGKRR